MKRIEVAKDFMEILREECGGLDNYLDAVWCMRCPQPEPKSSPHWPISVERDIILLLNRQGQPNGVVVQQHKNLRAVSEKILPLARGERRER